MSSNFNHEHIYNADDICSLFLALGLSNAVKMGSTKHLQDYKAM